MTINSAFDHNTAPDNLIDKKVKQIDSLLPSIEGKSGKVLAVKSDESGTEWKTVTSGTTDYTALTNKPKINSVELTGSKSLSDIGAASETDLAAETTARGVADTALQAQIDAIESQSDVVDIVATHAALVAYDTTKLLDNDVIKVLADETQYYATSYNRWVITENVGAWTLIGTLGPFYTKSESDTLLAAKEAAANKVTSFQATPDDTHFPSEKLVKDFLDAKIAGVIVNGTELTPDANKKVSLSVPTSVTVSIAVADWSGGTTVTKSVTGVTAANTVIASPAPASMSAAVDKKVLVTAQGAGTLTFTADATPASAIDFSVVIIP